MRRTPTSIRQRLHRPETKSLETGSSVSVRDPRAVELFSVDGYADGVRVDESTVMNLSAVHACVGIRSDCMAVMPIKVYRRTDEKGGREEVQDHPAHRLLNISPQPLEWREDTAHQHWQTSQAHIDLRGNTVWELVHNGRGQATVAHLLDPRRIIYDRDNRGRKVYRVMDDDGEKKLTSEEVVHVAGFNMDGYQGVNPVELARRSMRLSLFAQEHPIKFHEKGGKPLGALVSDRTIPPKRQNEIREDWHNVHDGNPNEIAVLSGGLKWNDIGLAPKDDDFLRSRKFQAEEIARWFRIPPHMLGLLDKATYDNVEQLNLEFLTYSLLPWVRKWENELNMKLFTRREMSKYYVELSFETFLRADTKTQMDLIEKEIRNGVATVNEMRQRTNRSPYDNGVGDQPLILGSQLVTLESVENGSAPYLQQVAQQQQEAEQRWSSGNLNAQQRSDRAKGIILSAVSSLGSEDREQLINVLEALRGKDDYITQRHRDEA